ncbi:hypothetical protein ACLX1H_000541 [Fusarium chlamydosporum]
MHSYILALALAASSVNAEKHIVWEHAKSSSQTSLSVYSDSNLLARTCSSFLPGSQSIDFFDVDANGFGNFTIGAAKYLVHSVAEYSGGPVCTKKYNHEATVEPISCGAAATCGVGESASYSYNIGWTASASAAGWISGGFSVTQSWITGKSYTCGGTTGDTVCIWYKTAHTAYTVHNVMRDSCQLGGGSEPNSDPLVMFSPSQDNRGGGGYYCVVRTCRAQGDSYWDYNGRAGGPWTGSLCKP